MIWLFPEGSEGFEFSSGSDDKISEKNGKCKGEGQDEAGGYDGDDDGGDDGGDDHEGDDDDQDHDGDDAFSHA